MHSLHVYLYVLATQRRRLSDNVAFPADGAFVIIVKEGDITLSDSNVTCTNLSHVPMYVVATGALVMAWSFQLVPPKLSKRVTYPCQTLRTKPRPTDRPRHNRRGILTRNWKPSWQSSSSSKTVTGSLMHVLLIVMRRLLRLLLCG